MPSLFSSVLFGLIGILVLPLFLLRSCTVFFDESNLRNSESDKIWENGKIYLTSFHLVNPNKEPAENEVGERVEFNLKQRTMGRIVKLCRSF